MAVDYIYSKAKKPSTFVEGRSSRYWTNFELFLEDLRKMAFQENSSKRTAGIFRTVSNDHKVIFGKN